MYTYEYYLVLVVQSYQVLYSYSYLVRYEYHYQYQVLVVFILNSTTVVLVHLLCGFGPHLLTTIHRHASSGLGAAVELCLVQTWRITRWHEGTSHTGGGGGHGRRIRGWLKLERFK